MEKRKTNFTELKRRATVIVSATGYLYPVILLSSIAWTPITHAQQVPDTVAPGRVEEQFKALQIPQSGGEAFIPESKPQHAPAGAQDIEFVLNKIKFEYLGDAENTPDYQGVYPQSNFRSEYEALLGAKVTVTQLYELANKITAAYRNEGYVLSRAYLPEQEIGKEGRVTIKLLEGFINEVHFSGIDPKAVRKLSRYSDHIKQTRPLTNQALERYMLLINDIAGVTARATLSKSAVSGAADLSIEVDEKSSDFSLSSNNRGSDFLGPYQITGQVMANKLGSLFQPSGLTIVSSGDSELAYGLLTHSILLGGEGLKLNLSASHSTAKPGGALEILDIKTETQTLGLGVRYPLIRSRTKNLALRSDLSLYDSESERLRNAEGSDILDTEDSLRSIRLGLTFDNIDAHGGLNLVDFEFSQGLEIFGSSETGDPGLSRENGKVDYSKVKLYSARLQAMSERWSLLGALTGQYAFDDLLSSEQFGVGGEQFVRGYDSSEIVGDSGLAAKLELRYAGRSTSKWLDSYVAYGFVDGGTIDRKSPDGEDASDSRSSTGLGFRYRIFGSLTGYLEFAVPLSNEDISSEGNNDPRVFFHIGTAY